MFTPSPPCLVVRIKRVTGKAQHLDLSPSADNPLLLQPEKGDKTLIFKSTLYMTELYILIHKKRYLYDSSRV